MSGSLLALVPAFPLLGVIVLAVLNRRLDRKAAGGIASLMVLLSAAVSFLTLFTLTGMEHGEGAPSLSTTLYQWMSVGGMHVDIGLVADPLSAVMMCVVTGIGALIHIYSIGYMDDPADAGSTWRFFTYLNLFIFSMLLLVMGDNFLLMFVGWEGVGLCSYLLIGFWYTNTDFAAAGRKAFIVNRVGDFSFVMGLFWLFWALGDHATLNFHQLEEVIVAHPELVGGLGGLTVTAVCMLFFGGATGKSAQIPLFVWLPDAMAGPTPVSALIHAATMVTSGIYMICRLNFLFALAPMAMGLVATIGALTALFAATIALTQTDIKKVLAYSTVSQLGYMFLGVGIGAFSAGFFHVLTHAFFKALLFLGAGAIIHALHHEQDMRKMGGLAKKMPITFACFVAAWLAIIGFPGFSGFFSKDEILWLTFSTPRSQVALFGADFPLPSILWAIGALAAVLTAFYMSRLMFMTFAGEYRGGGHEEHGHGGHGDHGHHEPHEVSPLLWGPLAVLGLLSVLGGLLNLPHWVSEHGWLHNFLHPVFEHAAVRFDAADPSLEIPLMGATLVMVAIGVSIAAWLYWLRPSDLEETAGEIPAALLKGSQNKWYIDEIYDFLVVRPLYLLSRQILWPVVDAVLIDGMVNGAARTARRVSAWYGRAVQIGQIQAYALAIAVGTAVFVFAFAVGA